MDSDRDEKKYFPTQELKDEEEPLPPSRQSSISQPFILTETLFRIITQKPTYETPFCPSSIQTVEASTTM